MKVVFQAFDIVHSLFRLNTEHEELPRITLHRSTFNANWGHSRFTAVNGGET